MTKNRGGISQWIRELGDSSYLNTLSPNDTRQIADTMTAALSEAAPGDFIATLRATSKTIAFEPALAVVVKKTEKTIKASIPPVDEGAQAADLTITLGKAPLGRQYLLASGQYKTRATDLIRTLGVHEGRGFGARAPAGFEHFDFDKPRDTPQASFYVVGEMFLEAERHAHDLGLPNPRIVSLGAPEDIALERIAKTLPGRSGETTDDSRGYTGWGPYEDYAHTIRCDSLDEALTLVSNKNLRIHDFYFGITHDSEECPSCLGTGHSREYAELSDNWYRFKADPRSPDFAWSTKLVQEEVDALVAEGRLNDFVYKPAQEASEWLTREEAKERTGDRHDRWFDNKVEEGHILQDGDRYQIQKGVRVKRTDGGPTAEEVNRAAATDMIDGKRWFGHDAINQWIAVRTRAKRYGIDGTCDTCEGEGFLATSHKRLELNLWAGDCQDESHVVIEIPEIDAADLPRVHAVLREHGTELIEELSAFADGTKLPRLPERLRGRREGDGWGGDIEYATWAEWVEKMGRSDLDLNSIFGYALITRDNCYATAKTIPEDCGMLVYMAHPRKGATRTCVIKRVTEDDRMSLSIEMDKHIDTHKRHFAWAFGPEPDFEAIIKGKNAA